MAVPYGDSCYGWRQRSTLFPYRSLKDEDRCVHRSNLLRSIENILETITLPENMVELMFHFDLLTEVNILGLELVFQCFDFRKSRPKFDSLSFQFVVRFF